MTTCQQVELPFESGGFTEAFETLQAKFEAALATAVAAAAAKRQQRAQRRRITLPDLTNVDLNQPLLFDYVVGIESEWMPSTETKEEPSTLEELTSLGCLPDQGKNNEFSTPTFETIALIASKLLYGDLQTLFNSRGNAANKREILNWIFAETYQHDGVEIRKPMHKIPFTAQFCCMVEEIDHTDLCEAIHQRVDCLRESKHQGLAEAQTSHYEGGIENEKNNSSTLWC
jgi:hypothetical protein